MNKTKLFGMLHAGMSATVVLRHFGYTRKTIERLRRLFCATGNVADRNRRLTAAATGRQYGIHPQTVRSRLRQNFQPIRAYSVKISPDVIERQGGIGAAVTCTSDVLIGI